MPVVGAGRQAELQRQVIPPSNIARRSPDSADRLQARPDDTSQRREISGMQSQQSHGSAAGAGMVVTLTGDVIMDGRRLGLLTAASQARTASLPAHGPSRVNLRAVPIYSGAQIPR